MSKNLKYPPLVNWVSMLKGIAGGGMLAGSLVCGWGFLAQAVIFALGFLVLLDGVMVSGRGVFIIICLITAIVSAAFAVALSFAGLLTAYLALMLLAAFLLYARTVLRPAQRAFKGR